MLLTEFDQKSYDNGLIKVGVEKEKEEERIKNIHNMFTLNLPPEIIAKTCEAFCRLCIRFEKRFGK